MTHISDFEPSLPDPHAYIERTLALYDRVVRERRGRVVFITGELGGGKTDLLGAIAKALHEAQTAPNFIAGFFRSGAYKPYTLSWQENVCLRKSVTAAGGIASLLGLFPLQYAFAATLLGQIIETCVGAREFSDAFNKSAQDRKAHADELKKMLRRAADKRPLVCLLDDWDEAQRYYWDDMLLSFSKEIAEESPVLLFITVKEPLDFHAPDKDASGLTAVIKSLTERGLADLWRLEKLTRDEVASAIGQAAPGIAAKLHGVTGGNARWVKELWREWRLEEIVVTDEADRWVWSEHRETTMNLYKDILEGRLKQLLKAETALEVEEAREVLACAALEGVHFTADAVARVLNWERDELIDFLDDVLVQTDDNPGGLLLEDESISIPTPDGATRTLCRYHFVSDLHWMALERYGFANQLRPEKSDTERREKSKALAEALIKLYAPEEKFVAAPLARLLRETGNKDAAQHYQLMADHVARREAMRAQALHLITLNKDNWDQWHFERTVKFLIEAGQAMINTFPQQETLSVFEEACKMAPRIKDQYNEAWAHFYCGYALLTEGEYKDARVRANNSLNIFQLIRKKTGEAFSLSLLAEISYAEDEYADAKEHATQSLKISYQIGDQEGEADSLSLMAAINLTEGRDIDARERATQSLKVSRQMGNREREAYALSLLAETDQAEGKYADARERATQSLKINRQTGNRRGEAVLLGVLADIDHAEGNYDDAQERATQSLEIDIQTGYRRGQALTLNSLAKIHHAEGKYGDAQERATQSLKISCQIGERRGQARSLSLIAHIACDLERNQEALILLTFSNLVFTQIGGVNAKKVKSLLEELVAKYNYSDEEQQEIYKQVSEAYAKDGGAELIENALATLREAQK